MMNNCPIEVGEPERPGKVRWVAGLVARHPDGVVAVILGGLLLGAFFCALLVGGSRVEVRVSDAPIILQGED